jgi:5'-AMP-activated protein kinase regulatory gamma subunit
MPPQALIRSGSYTQLDLSIRSALALRSPEFQGAVTCTGSDSLGKLLEFLRTVRVHRVVVVEGDTLGADGVSKKGRLVGIITLSDVLRYLVGKGEKGKDSGLTPMTPLQRGPPSPLPGASSLPSATSLP